MAAPDIPGHRFGYWLGIHVGQVMDDHGYTAEDVASYTGVVKETVAKFVKGRSRPHDEEGIVAAVAEMCGIDDPRDLYVDAMRRWYNEGSAPKAKRSERRSGDAALAESRASPDPHKVRDRQHRPTLPLAQADALLVQGRPSSLDTPPRADQSSAPR